MTHYIKFGNKIYIRDDSEIDLGGSLPIGTYIVERSPMQGFYLVKTNDFERIKRYYGDTEERAKRIINTFNERAASTGVMFTGEKGSGKTLLAKLISHELRVNQDMPTIIVNTAFVNTEVDKSIQDAFLKFMQSIDTKAVILFDEFEKMYDYNEDQQSILTLLDGVFASNKLFVFTCNDKYKIDRHLRNRPSRIYYMIDYTGLDEMFIREYLDENLKHDAWYDKIIKISGLFQAFNFDMLQSIVEEINRYNIDPMEAMAYLNIKPENDNSGHDYWTIESLDVKDESWMSYVKTKKIYHSPFKTSALVIELNHDDYESIEFDISDIFKYDGAAGKVGYRNSDGETLVISSDRSKTFDMTKLL